MNIDNFVAEVEAEISRLEKVRDLLKGTSKALATPSATPTIKKRTMSKESRQKIADAQRKRWKKHRKEASTAPKKKTKANGVPVAVPVPVPVA